MASFGLDHRGVVLAQGDKKAFHNQTLHCVGSVTILRGVSKGSGYCRNVDPATGDFVLVEWDANGKPGTGTFRYVYGTGKWKGITGSGEYQTLAATRPVGPATRRPRGTKRIRPSRALAALNPRSGTHRAARGG